MSHTPSASQLLSPEHFKLLPPASFTGSAVTSCSHGGSNPADNHATPVRLAKRQVKTRATPIAEAAILRECLQDKQESFDSGKAWAWARAEARARGGGANLKVPRKVQRRVPREIPWILASEGRGQVEGVNDLDVEDHQDTHIVVHNIPQDTYTVPGHKVNQDVHPVPGHNVDQDAHPVDQDTHTVHVLEHERNAHTGQRLLLSAESAMDETSSDVVLAQVLQRDEYSQAAYQDTPYQDTSYQDTPHQDTAPRDRSRRRGPDLSSDYILARHVQEQSDAEVAMQLQESGGWSNGRGYSEHNGRKSGDRRDGCGFSEQSGGWGFEEETERDGKVYRHHDMWTGDMDKNGKPNRSPASQSQHHSGGHHPGGHHPGGHHPGGHHFGGHHPGGHHFGGHHPGGHHFEGHHPGGHHSRGYDSGRSQHLAMQAEAAQQIDMSYEALSELEDVSHGVDPDILSNITSTHHYTPRPSASEESRTCAVCMTLYVSGEELRSLPCLHTFHSHCVDQWLSSHTQCPVCMKDIKEQSLP